MPGRLYHVAIAAFVFAVALAGCVGGRETPSSVASAPWGSSTSIVAVIGDTEADVRRAIKDATDAGRTPRYVRVVTALQEHVFPPYAQILRSQDAIIARSYDMLYIWKGSDATVFWSGQKNAVNAELPAVTATNIDAVANRLVGPQSGKLLIWDGQRPRSHDDPWAGLKDPWQVNPDYVVNPPSVASSATTIAGAGRGSARSARKPSFEEVCSIDGNTLWGCYYYYSYYYSPFGSGPRGGGTGGGGGTYSGPPCAPSKIPSVVKAAYNSDLFAQAVLQAVAAANNGTPLSVNELATRPTNAPVAVADSNNGTRQMDWYDDQMGPAIQKGYSAIQVFVHETLHMWYRNYPPGGASAGDYPNPFPGEASFVASPSVTFSDGTVVQFNLISASGVLDSGQYMAYEHLLIHDDMVQQYGTDTLTGSIAEALAAATSVTLPGGSAQKMDPNTANTVAPKLKSSPITNRRAKRPPTTPASNGGCTSTSSRGRQPASVRSIQTDDESVGGFAVKWHGVPLPTWPN